MVVSLEGRGLGQVGREHQQWLSHRLPWAEGGVEGGVLPSDRKRGCSRLHITSLPPQC